MNWAGFGDFAEKHGNVTRTENVSLTTAEIAQYSAGATKVRYVFEDGSYLDVLQQDGQDDSVVGSKETPAKTTKPTNVTAPSSQPVIVRQDADGNLIYEANPNYKPTSSSRTAAQEDASSAAAQASRISAQATALRMQAAVAKAPLEQQKLLLEVAKLEKQIDELVNGAPDTQKVGKTLLQWNAETKQYEPVYTDPQTGSQIAYQQQTAATIEKGKQGLAYGLEDQIAAIRKAREQVFGPGGSGDPAEADKFLQDYVNSTLGGTTVSGAFESDRAAETSRITQRVTQRGQQASERQGAFGNFAETARYAPKGTNVGAAFESFMASQPKAVDVPQAPSFLEAYRQKTGAPAKTAAVSTPSVATPATVSGGITINIGGGGATGTTTETVGAAETPALGKTEGASEYSPEVIELLAKMNAIPSGPGGSYIPQYTSGQKAVEVPEALRGKNLATPDDVMALWKDDFAV